MLVGSSSTSIVDSGATNHVCNSLQGFKRQRERTNGEHRLRVGNGAHVWAKAVGDLFLYFDSISFI